MLTPPLLIKCKLLQSPISLRWDRFALSSQIILIVFITLLINSELYKKIVLS